jgi:CRISPR/Cas system CSM-associated protein Csm3 (group 7 of RAMP superfamily)
MARQIQTRWKINATLKAITPIHVGGLGKDADTDLALAMNGCGNYYVPGTSLAGSLRGWMSQLLNDIDVKKLWGSHEDKNLGASLIIIDDAEIELRDGKTIEIREGVGIDRNTGAAADKMKYSRAILPKGISLPLNITLDCQDNKEPIELWQLLQALEYGDIRIGAAKTRGLGRVKLENVTIHQQCLGNAEGIFETLLNGGIFKNWEVLKPKNYQSPPHLSLEIAWKPRDPVMVKAEGDGMAVDMLPLVSQIETGVRFVIPGSSIKGVLRAHAERIVRTVCHKEKKDNFLEQVQLELINEIFGTAEQSAQKSESRKPQSQGKIGALSIDDCYATIPITTENWANVEKAKKGKNEDFGEFKTTLATALGGSKNPFQTLQPAMHVAIDRWTGGAAEKMLYSVLEPIGVTWDAIGLYLDLKRLQTYDSNLVKPAIALLLLVLRDFANRKIPIGYGTNRGMGTVEVTAMKLRGSSTGDLVALEGETLIEPDLSSLDAALLDDLTEEWKGWIHRTLSHGERVA